MQRWYSVRREDGIVRCHVFKDGVGYELRHVVKHSPTGFEFGYGGSGPADLALAILTDYVGAEKAEDLHQGFKWLFIAPMTGNGRNILASEIDAWLKLREVHDEHDDGIGVA